MYRESRDFSPYKSTTPHKHYRDVSPPLMRFFGAVGFSVVGLSVVYFGADALNIPRNFWTEGSLDTKTVGLLIGALLGGGLGMLIGVGIGVSIPVTSERLNHRLSLLWHYTANGTIIWSFLYGLILTKIYGKEGIKTFVNTAGEWYMGLWTIALLTAGFITAGILIILTGAHRQDSRPKFLLCFLVTLPVTLLISNLEFTKFGISSQLWILLGILTPLALIPASAFTVQRDRFQREQVNTS